MIESFTDLYELIKRQPISPKERFYLAWYEYNKDNLPWRYVYMLCPYRETDKCPLYNDKKETCPWGYHVLKRCRMLQLALSRPRKIRGWYRR